MIKYISIITMMLLLCGCPKQLVRTDDVNVPIVVSSNTVNVPVNATGVDNSSGTINIASDNVFTASATVNVGSNNSFSVSSGAFSNNNFDVHIPSQAITGAIDKFIKGGKWWQWLLLIVGLVFVLATEIIVKGKKDKNG